MRERHSSCPSTPRPTLVLAWICLPQLEALDLARGRLGKRLDEFDPSWVLERSEALFAEALQLLGGGARGGLQDDEGLGLVELVVVLVGDDRGFEHAGMRDQSGLDLGRRHPLAARLDHVVGAAAVDEVAFRVLLVTPGNVFLEQALRLRTDLQIDVVAPAAYRASAAYALTVFDQFSPAVLPDGPFVMVDPPAGSALAGGQPVGIGRVRAVDAGDPLLANVDLQDVHIARSQDLRASTFGRPLISSLQTPLVLLRDEPFRQVLVGFDLHASDLPLRIAFPILVQNLSEWLLPPSVPSHSFHPDEPVTIVPESGATSVSVVRPDGSRRPLAAGSIATFGDTDPTGLYTVEQTIAGKLLRSWFSVNLFSEPISQLKPPDRLTLPPTRTTITQATHQGQLEIWPWIALAALAVVTAEWLAFHRGL